MAKETQEVNEKRISLLPEKTIHEIEEGGEIWKALLAHYDHPTVYIIQCQQYFKIGFTEGSIEDRMWVLQSANPFKLRLVFAIKTRTAKELEKKLHLKFAHRRVMREWFELIGGDWQELEAFLKENWKI